MDSNDPTRPYEPHGGIRRLFELRNIDGEILMSGPAGTGKTCGILNLLWWYAATYQGMRGLIIRKTRESLTESVLATWERVVVPANHPCLDGASRGTRKSYRIGDSEIIVAGMKASGRDMTQNVMSTDYDVICAFEAIEFTEEEWEKLTTRLRNNHMPNQILIADTNPSSPRHWLKQRANQGRTTLIESRHEDNPMLYDRATGIWTRAGEKYIAKLDALTGARHARLRKGLWVQAEGIVYEEYDPAIHVVDAFEVPRAWPRYWSIDFGYTNPFVCQFWAKDPDGRLFMYRELYQTGLLVEEAAIEILKMAGAWRDGKVVWNGAREPRPQAVICDHDAEGRATLEKYLRMKTTPAKKDVMNGIQAMQKRLRIAGDGKPRMFFFNSQDTLWLRDTELDEAKKPCCTLEEIDGYIWRPRVTVGFGSKGEPEEPVKENDHGADCARYVCAYFEKLAPTIHSAAQTSVTGQPQTVPLPPQQAGKLEALGTKNVGINLKPRVGQSFYAGSTPHPDQARINRANAARRGPVVRPPSAKQRVGRRWANGFMP